MSARRTLAEAGWVEPSKLPRGPNGHALCRFCKSTECQPPRRTFCSAACVHEWKIRTQPDYAKREVAKRDDGICAICRTDTFATRRSVWANRGGRRPKDGLSLFEMDHIVSVVEGGGCCGLQNLRTSCRACHRKLTAELAARRATERRKRMGVLA